MTRILACTDGSLYAGSVYDHAAWAAGRMKADTVQVLHVLERAVGDVPVDRSGTLGFDASEELLAELAALDAARGKVALRRARALLADAERRLRAGGVADVETTQRHGALVDTVAEFEPGADLLVIGKRGEAADFARGHLGASLERVVRASRLPVLVAARAFRPITRFLIAHDGGPAALKAVDYVAREPLLKGLECHLVTVGAPGGGVLDQAAAPLRSAGFEVTARTLEGDPEKAIGAHVGEAGIDLLVMGAYGHSRIRTLLIGSTTTALLRACRIPVIVFR
ncbi:universal stress protein [Roseomonas sp. HF4]|uniref:universal stress protein n=1 Tax=Roseomonas sp. HF4 TaxID=2562313 RepID=UPI0010C03FD2|nr:universal stress protein [Roseomonas sp. HF4]